jgi:hypothetical protein
MEFCLSCMGVIYLVCGAEGEVLDLRSDLMWLWEWGWGAYYSRLWREREMWCGEEESNECMVLNLIFRLCSSEMRVSCLPVV